MKIDNEKAEKLLNDFISRKNIYGVTVRIEDGS